MLPPATEKVWEFLRNRPELSGFVLVGGSALSLRINHRISEDLDLTFPDHQLPRHRLDAFVLKAGEAGFQFAHNDDEAAIEEFVQGGLELRDYQQDFLVDGTVKVSFFVSDEALRRVLQPGQPVGVRTAELTELFQSKCLLSARRSKTRDWFDLYVLFQAHGFTWRDYVGVFAKAGIESQADAGLARLCAGVPQRDDEGFSQLLPDPPTVSTFKAFFTKLRDEREIETAAEVARQGQSNPRSAGGGNKK